MSNLFVPQSRRIFVVGLATAGCLTGFVAAGLAYYGTPKYWRVGYEPVQPVSFSHAQHVQDLGLDCRYCHNHVEESPHSNVPSTQVCMNCHGQQWGNIKALSDTLKPLRIAHAEGKPLPWVRIHRVPDYAYFNHAVHVRRGVSCVSCHGQVNEMEVVQHAEPLSMGWCLECHRNPEPHLRPADRVTDLEWSVETDSAFGVLETRERFLNAMLEEVGINPPEDCSACHR